MSRDPAARAALGLALSLTLGAPAVRATDGVPHFDHVVIVIEENHSFSQIIGSPAAPYINALAAGGALMTQSYAIEHPSQPNYVALFSGSTQGVTDDSVFPHSQFTAPNLGAKLIAAGLSFGGYSETMPSVGFDGASFGTAPFTYKRKHNPWVNWQDASVPLPANKLPPEVNMPYAGFFPAATDYDSLPALCFVIPNQGHDMHDGTIAQADAWLQANLGAYADWCVSHDSLLLLTFDEDHDNEGNRIATIFHGANVQPGQYAEVIDHYDVLRTLEAMFGLPHDAGSAEGITITDIWQGSVWTDLGFGLAGIAGIPDLVGTGSLAAGSPGSLALSAAHPSAPALLFISFASVPAPFKGGVLAAFPPALMLTLATNGAGALTLSFTWPSGVPPATSVYFQFAIPDGAAPFGVALSHAVKGVTP